MRSRLKGIIINVIAVILVIVILLTPAKTYFTKLGGVIISPFCKLFDNVSTAVTGWFDYMIQAGEV